MGGSLNRNELMSVATTQTGLDDFGDIPFHEPLDVLIDTYCAPVYSACCGRRNTPSPI